MNDPRFARPDGIYLLSHSIGLPPADVAQQVEAEYFRAWREQTPDAWSFWLSSIDRFRAALGELLGSAAGNFCPQANLSSGLTKVLHALPRDPARNAIVLTEQDFPSIGFVVDRAQSRGYEPRYIPSDQGVADPDVWRAHLSDDVAVAVVTQVHSNTSLCVPVDEIVALARERGIVSVVDIAQSAGVVPIDLDALGADFAIGSCVKWLCGGPGAGYLWAHPEIVGRCEPLDVGWFSHADPFEFDIHHFEYATDALRFWGGTPSVLPFVAARRSIELIRSIGVDAIQAHNRSLTERLANALDVELLVSPRDADARGGTLVINLGRRQADVSERLATAHIHCDARATGIRLSPHIYNSAEEIDAVIGCLSD